jgi:hypothetical protein
MKKNYLTRAERLQFSLSAQLKDILVGLILGDLFMQKRSKLSLSVPPRGTPSPRVPRGDRVRCCFGKGLVHKEYLLHLYELFKTYGSQVPQIFHVFDKRTGKEYGKIRFSTYALPCFNELYELFYPKGIKKVPSNIGDLLTPLGLCYWIADDGGFCKKGRTLTLATNSYILSDVQLLADVLTNKFGLKCAVYKKYSGYVISISPKSLPVLQNLLKDLIPSMMLHKIGL